MRLYILILLVTAGLSVRAQQKNIYYPSGLVQYSYQIKEGNLDGEFVCYYENELIKAKGSFVNGQKTGTWKAWDISGVLRTQRVYKENNDFDIIKEWTADGREIEKEEALSSGKKYLSLNGGHHDDIFYNQRYWKKLLPQPQNQELFDEAFRNALSEQLKADKLFLYDEERFITSIPEAEAVDFLSKRPVEILIKEDHTFDAFSQKMFTRIIGLGFTYIEREVNRTVWIYFPDAWLFLRNMCSPQSDIVDKLSNQGYTGEIVMTTVHSQDWKPRKTDDKEKDILLLAEIDFEAQAWIYLLDKELRGSK